MKHQSEILKLECLLTFFHSGDFSFLVDEILKYAIQTIYIQGLVFYCFYLSLEGLELFVCYCLLTSYLF